MWPSDELRCVQSSHIKVNFELHLSITVPVRVSCFFFYSIQPIFSTSFLPEIVSITRCIHFCKVHSSNFRHLTRARVSSVHRLSHLRKLICLNTQACIRHGASYKTHFTGWLSKQTHHFTQQPSRVAVNCEMPC